MSLTDSELTLGVLFRGRVDSAFRKATNDLRGILGGLEGSAGKVTRSFDSVGKAAKRSGQEMQGVGKHLIKTSEGFERLTNSLKFIAAYGLAARVIWGTVNSLKAGTKAVIDYDQALKNLQAITSATDVEIAALGTVIKTVASNTKFSAVEVGEAAVLLGQAGFTASESIDAIGAVANLATGTLTSMSTSADLLTTAIRAFHLEAQEANKVSDIFASAVNKSKLTIDKLRIAFNYLGPVSHQVGISLEEAAASTMLLANAGLRGSTIGTGLRRVLQQLVKPSEKMRILLAATGGDIKKLNPAANDMATVFSELQKILGKNVDQTERARRAFELFGLRGASVAAIFAQEGAEGFEKMYNEVLRVGTASAMAEKQMEGLGVMLKNLKDRLGVLAIAIGQGGLADGLRFLIVPVRELIILLTELSEGTIGRMAIAVGSLTLAMTALRLAIRYTIFTLTALFTGQSIAGLAALSREVNILRIAWVGVTAAASKFALFLVANPWLALFGLVSSLAVAFISLKKAHDDLLPSLRKTVVEETQVINKLEMYNRQLAEAEKGSAEYKAIVERVKNEFVELKEKIDLASGSYQEQGIILDAITEKYRELFEVLSKIEYVQLGSKTNETIAYFTRLKEEAEAILAVRPNDENAKRDLASAEAALAVFLKNNKDAINEQAAILEKTYKDMADILLKMGADVFTSFDDLVKMLTDDLGKSENEAKRIALNVKRIFESLKFDERKAIGQSTEEMLSWPTQRQQIGTYGDEWLRLYDRLSEERKIDLLETVEAMKEKIEKAKEEGEKIGLTVEQIEIKKRQIIEETLRRFLEAETEKEKRARAAVQNILAEWAKVTKGGEFSDRQELENWYGDRKAAIVKDVTNESQRYDALRKLQEAYDAKRRQIDLKYWEFKEENQRRLGGVGMGYNQMDDEIRFGQETLDIHKRMTAEKLEVTRRYWEEEVRLGQMSIEEYHRLLEEAHYAELISEEELANKKDKINQNALTSFKRGMFNALKEVKTFSELMYDIGNQLADRISDEFIDAFGSIIDGSKSAKDAFADMAVDMLSWMAKMIAKLALMKAMQSAYNSTGSSIFGAFAGALFHGGGIIGKSPAPVRIVNPDMFRFAPRFHNGLMPGEYPAILKKNEGVFTPEQMKALGKGGGAGQVVINSSVTVNVTQSGGGSQSNDPAQNETLGRDLSRVITSKMNENLREQLRPGGIIDQHIRSR